LLGKNTLAYYCLGINDNENSFIVLVLEEELNQIFAAAAGATTYSLTTLSNMTVSIMRLT
jgi:hypothetical protein